MKKLQEFEHRLLRVLRESRLIRAGHRVAVGVSGGADSVALLRLLHSLREKLGITLCAAHFDHGLRGPESQSDADFVARLSRALGVELLVDGADVRGAARHNRWNLEDAARRLRHGFFRRLVAEGRASVVAVAHTGDDQAETVLARLLRGCGPAGLASIQPRAGSVVRPLLDVRRSELRAYLRELGQHWCEDETNADLSRQRARIRGRLLPVLESDFSPQIVENLCRLARLSHQEEEFWSALVNERLNDLSRITEHSISIPAGDLLSPLPLRSSKDSASQVTPPSRALAQRMIRECFCRLHRRGELAAVHVDQILRVARSQSGSCAQLPGGVLVHNRLGQIVFERAKNAQERSAGETGGDAVPFRYPVALPSRGQVTVPVPEVHTSFRLKVIDWPCSERETRHQQGVLDAARLHPPLILRSWQPGDAYRPCARRRPRKLKRMFLEARVPKEQRLAWPVLESGGEIIWARNMPPAKEYQAGRGTRRAIVIEEFNLPGCDGLYRTD